MRPRMSVVPPGAKLTMYLIGLFGQACACAAAAAAASTIATNTLICILRVCCLNDAGQNRFTGEVSAQVLDLQVAQRLARLDRGARHVRKQHRIVEREELG